MFAVGLLCRIECTFAALVAHDGPQVRIDTSKRCRNGPVQRQRALATAQHQESQGPFTAAVTSRWLGDGRDVLAHRIADGFRVDRRIKTAREGLQHNPGKTRQKTVGQARCGILLVDHEWAPGQPGGNTTGTTDESTHAEYGRGTTTQDDGERLQERPADS